MSPEEKKNLRYTLATLGITALVGGAIVKYDQEIYDAGKKAYRSLKTSSSNRLLTSKELSNLSSSEVKLHAQGMNSTSINGCDDNGSSRGTTFRNNQTKEIYVLTTNNSCYNYDILNITVEKYPASIVKNDHKLNLTLLKVNYCYDCLPHFEGKITSSTEVGDNFRCDGISTTGQIIYKGVPSVRLYGSAIDVTTNMIAPGRTSGNCVVLENNTPHFIGRNFYYDLGMGGLPNLESLRSFIKGTPLEDELL